MLVDNVILKTERKREEKKAHVNFRRKKKLVSCFFYPFNLFSFFFSRVIFLYLPIVINCFCKVSNCVINHG